MAATETKTNLTAAAKAIAKAATTNLTAEIKKLGLPKKEQDALLKKVAGIGKQAEVVVSHVKKLETEMKEADKMVTAAGKTKAAAAKKAATTAVKAAPAKAAAKPAPKAAAPKAATKPAAKAPAKPAAPKAPAKAPAKKAAAKPAADAKK